MKTIIGAISVESGRFRVRYFIFSGQGRIIRVAEPAAFKIMKDCGYSFDPSIPGIPAPQLLN